MKDKEAMLTDDISIDGTESWSNGIGFRRYLRGGGYVVFYLQGMEEAETSSVR